MWKRKRMDRMMVEHLLRCGYYNTAVKLARQSGIEVGSLNSWSPLRSEHHRIPFRSYLLWCPNSHWRSQDKINLLLANLNLLALWCLRRPEGWCFWQELPGVSDMPMGRYCCFLAPDQWPLFIVTATRHWIPSLCMVTRVYHWTHGLPHFLSCYFL